MRQSAFTPTLPVERSLTSETYVDADGTDGARALREVIAETLRMPAKPPRGGRWRGGKVKPTISRDLNDRWRARHGTWAADNPFAKRYK